MFSKIFSRNNDKNGSMNIDHTPKRVVPVKTDHKIIYWEPFLNTNMVKRNIGQKI